MVPLAGVAFKIDRSDAVVSEARQLSGVGDAIVIGVLPHFKLAKSASALLITPSPLLSRLASAARPLA